MDISKLINIIVDNKEWLFSGIGVFFIGLLVNRLLVRGRTEQTKRKVESIQGDSNIRFGNNVNIEHFVVKHDASSLNENAKIAYPTNGDNKKCVHLKIDLPKQDDVIERQPGETIPVIRAVKGRVLGYADEELVNLQLRVTINILADKWYPQGITKVQKNRKWELEVHYGGFQHTIKATLLDKDNNEIEECICHVALHQ